MDSTSLFHLILISVSIADCAHVNKLYRPDWDSLDKRPLPEWYDQAKIGIIVHWGVFSVPSFGSEWFWKRWYNKKASYMQFMHNNYPPGFTYQEFAPNFRAEFFDPKLWADIFGRAGAQYVIVTAKHFDGYALFPSQRSFSWNSAEVGPRRDIIYELSQSIQEQGLRFGVYYSLLEWFNPLFISDKNEFYNTQNFPEMKVIPDLKQLVRDYKPSIIWADGDWEALDTYWNSTSFLAWLYNESPVADDVVVNDRWGMSVSCQHGDFFNCIDKYNPRKIQPHKWENVFSLDQKSWGFRRNMELADVMTMDEILFQIVSSVSCGGNALINVGPTKEGIIAPIFQERLNDLGEWLSVNGFAIYATSPWYYQHDSVNTDVWYTCTKQGPYDGHNPTGLPVDRDKITAIYALILKWPINNILIAKDLAPVLENGNYTVALLGNEVPKLNWVVDNEEANIQLPDRAFVTSKYAWVVKLSRK